MKNTILTSFLLHTKDASEICKLIKNGELHLRGGKLFAEKNGTAPNQHIYLCSSLPIKEGDWIIAYKDTNDGSFLHKVSPISFPNLKVEDKKIEFTTDPKLIADGVPKIDGNTKAIGVCPNCKGNGCNLCESMPYEVNFLEEFCNRYNQKDNQKAVDVEKLAEAYIRNGKDFAAEGFSEYQNGKMNGFIDGFKASQTLQSNAGGFSLEDMRKALEMMRDVTEDKYYAVDVILDHFKSLTKEKSKGDIVIECEMEEFNPHAYPEGSTLEEWKQFQKPKIKLDSNGQPTLIFK